MSLKGKLQRFKSHLVSEGQNHENSPPPALPVDEKAPPIRVPHEDEWRQLQAKPFYYEEDYAMVREVVYPLDFQHGKYVFQDIHPIVDRWNQAAFHHPLSTAGTSASDLIFFDTETTGLHGGAGNTIFLLGVGRILQDRVIVKQYFLPGPESEIALYHGFLGEVGEMKNLVTYNGKAFDWPQVKTRHTLLRNLLPKLPAFGHYDLLHGARRLWKDTLESCRLSMVEKEILQFERKDDTPGYLAPLLYFDYLKDKNPLTMKGVFEHNEWDILSLISLYIHISTLLQDKSGSETELFQIGRWYEQCGEWDQAMTYYHHCLSSPTRYANQVRFSLAALYKKQKQWNTAISLWEHLAKDAAPHAMDAYVELSKTYEHHLKDYEKALHFADQAYECWKAQQKVYRLNSGDKTLFLKRIERLEKKCFRSIPLDENHRDVCYHPSRHQGGPRGSA